MLLVKWFLEKNGGEIWLERVEGEGSSFYFTLPNEKPLLKKGSSDEIMFDESAQFIRKSPFYEQINLY